jgi:putative peptidoglycan lipid II flippase
MADPTSLATPPIDLGRPDPGSSHRREARSAALVGAAVLLSRLLGLVRQRVFAHFFGDSWIADAFTAALRVPNITQNLLGEGTLSASLIPIYARELGRGDRDKARSFAQATLGLLLTAAFILSLLGFLFAPQVTRLIVPGFDGEKLALAISLVRIFFPMTGLLALSAWTLGILNSHRQFFLPYAAPVLWSLSQIAALLIGSHSRHGAQLAIFLGYGALAGAALQLLIQIPRVRQLLGGLRPTADWKREDVRRSVRAFGPVVLGRGIVQISAFFDTLLASLLGTGANAALGYVQTLYLLPVSLFGVGAAAAALPEMSRESAGGDLTATHGALRARLAESLTRVGFTTLPTTVGFVLLPEQIVGAIFQTGRFDAAATAYVAPALAVASLGLLANASVRILASAFYALSDTATPARFAFLRVVVSVPTSYLLMERFGVAGICAGAAAGGWIEAVLMAVRARSRLGGLPLSRVRWMKLLGASAFAGLAGVLSRALVSGWAILPKAAVCLSAFGLAYLAACTLLQVTELDELRSTLRRRFGK